MAITLTDVTNHARDLLRETTGDSLSGSTVEEYVRQTYYDWCEDLAWPEATWTDNSVAETQEYSLPGDLNLIFRVYMNGNRIPATTIPLLEGDVQQIFDASWRVLPSVTVPALVSGAGLSVPITAGPGYSSMKYYLRGGLIGFTPKPAAVYPMRIEGAAIPTVPASGSTLVLPDQCRDGLAWGAVYRFLLSDRRVSEAGSVRNLEQDSFIRTMSWRRRMGGWDQLPAVIPNSYRRFYSQANS